MPNFLVVVQVSANHGTHAAQRLSEAINKHNSTGLNEKIDASILVSRQKEATPFIEADELSMLGVIANHALMANAHKRNRYEFSRENSNKT